MAKIPYCHHWVYQEVVASPTLGRDVSVPFMRQTGSLGPLGMGQPHFRPRDAGDAISQMRLLQGHSTNIKQFLVHHMEPRHACAIASSQSKRGYFCTVGDWCKCIGLIQFHFDAQQVFDILSCLAPLKA